MVESVLCESALNVGTAMILKEKSSKLRDMNNEERESELFA